jgi:pyridoxamine 5'-phosphate oxidase
MDLSDLRISYTKDSFSESDLLKNPFDQFEKWFSEALKSKVDEPNAMSLATISPDGNPRTRIVLVKDFSKDGLIFYTNYESAKAKGMEENKAVSVNFVWHPLQRQINIQGITEKVDRKVSELYFHSRPRGSQLGALVSPQSKVIASRKVLEDRLAELNAQYKNKPIPLPENWGGIRIVPTRFEFWQGRDNRLHDRFEYILKNDQWSNQRLAP